MADFHTYQADAFGVGNEIFDIDSLVDDSLNNTGTLNDEIMYGFNCNNNMIVQVKTMEGQSPFHESDSGVSDVSQSPCSDRNLALDDLLLDGKLDDMETGPFTEISHDLDQQTLSWLDSECRESAPKIEVGLGIDSSFTNESVGLASLLDGTDFLDETVSNESMGNGDILQESRPQAKACPRSCQDFDTESRNDSCKRQLLCHSSVCDESEQSLSDKDNESSSAGISSRLRRRPKGSIRVGQRGAKLPAAVTNTGKCNVTSVKVLRIVNPDSENKTEDFIEKALEERNRKNAEMARQNRLKKKAYVGNLEEQLESYKQKVDKLESALNAAEEEAESYKKQTEYLKAVLANQSALAGLLKNIPGVEGVTLSSSLCRKRVLDSELDHSYTPIKKVRHSRQSDAGVCLHVSTHGVSLEACRQCAAMACGQPS